MSLIWTSYNSLPQSRWLLISMQNGVVRARWDMFGCFLAKTFTDNIFLQLVGPIFQSLADELTEVKFVKVDTDKHEDKGIKLSCVNFMKDRLIWLQHLISHILCCSVDSFNIQGLPLFGIFRNGKMVSCDTNCPVRLYSLNQMDEVNHRSAD